MIRRDTMADMEYRVQSWEKGKRSQSLYFTHAGTGYAVRLKGGVLTLNKGWGGIGMVSYVIKFILFFNWVVIRDTYEQAADNNSGLGEKTIFTTQDARNWVDDVNGILKTLPETESDKRSLLEKAKKILFKFLK
jgi:hypothetical protein